MFVDESFNPTGLPSIKLLAKRLINLAKFLILLLRDSLKKLKSSLLDRESLL